MSHCTFERDAILERNPHPAAAPCTDGTGPESGSIPRVADLIIVLTVRAEDARDVRHWTLRGLMVAEDDAAALPSGPARLLRGGGVMATSVPDAFGALVFTGLEAGLYNLVLTLADQVLTVEGIAVGHAQP